MKKRNWAGAIVAVLIGLSLCLSQTAQAECPASCRISDDGLAVIKQFEGFRPYRYYDVAGHATIGFGHKIRPGEKFDEPFMGYQAHAQLVKDAASAERSVKRWIWVPLKQPQYDALVSWTYNLGERYLKSSQMREYVNLEWHVKVPAQIRRWVFVGKTKYNGLVARREMEALMYQSATQ